MTGTGYQDENKSMSHRELSFCSHDCRAGHYYGNNGEGYVRYTGFIRGNRNNECGTEKERLFLLLIFGKIHCSGNLRKFPGNIAIIFSFMGNYALTAVFYAVF